LATTGGAANNVVSASNADLNMGIPLGSGGSITELSVTDRCGDGDGDGVTMESWLSRRRSVLLTFEKLTN
jgi:hypothetical protein